jgi:hypothetical protein
LILLHIKLVSFYEHVNTQIIDTGAEKTTVKLIEFELHPNNSNREDGFSSTGHGSLLFATYGNIKSAPNKNMMHPSEP